MQRFDLIPVIRMDKLFVICIAAFVAVSGVSSQREIHPCHGRNEGFARDINTCNQFWRCFDNPPTRGVCPGENTFDGESQRCVLPRNRNCFTCPQERSYELRSVPGVCHQYTRCFNGRPTLHACPNQLVFDGRDGIRNCNVPPTSGGCHRENEENQEDHGLCPNVEITRPLYFRDRDSCSR